MKRLFPVAVLCLILGIVIGAVGLRLIRGASDGPLAQDSNLRPTYLFNLLPERAEELIIAVAMQPGTRTAGGELIGETQIGYLVSDAANCETSGDAAEFLQSFLQSDRFQCVMMSWKDN
ncbi:hypothetical protein [uncultured Paracoccus sp.]|uniref:hypothetical protein n=1 Tax=uncultured Paracoccus sp. TaxID=189685 RepID=UPI0026368438|nr:hypothetical protein [uncultured Paracoccus sp.]